jgi:YD repeat-containing protein
MAMNECFRTDSENAYAALLGGCVAQFVVRCLIGLFAVLGVIGENRTIASALNYSFDSLNRLTNVDYGNGSVISYTYDAAGNRLTYSGTAQVDTIAPTVTMVSPTTGPAFQTFDSHVNVSGTASDNAGVCLVTWANDRGGSGTASGTTNWTVTGIPLQIGMNIVSITARDTANNFGSATLAVIYNLSPPMQAAVSGSDVVVSWPVSASGFVLQSADTLSPPVLWSNAVTHVTTNSGILTVTLPATNEQKFFRLLKQP